MKVLYFNNFKGFGKTFLPLADVNFFVGENSTGKTSVLKLIKVLLSQTFWYNQNFKIDEIDLGYFSEIANITRKKDKYFEIGLMMDSIRYKEKTLCAIKLKFIEIDGLPEIEEICFIDELINFQITIDEKEYKYKYSLTSPFVLKDSNVNEKDSLASFKEWIEDNRLNKSETEIKVRSNSNYRGFFVFFEIDMFISDLLEKANIKNPSLTFSYQFGTQEIVWLAPIRTEPKRTYDSYEINFNPDGTHAPYKLKKVLDVKNNKITKEYVEKTLENYGRESGMFDSIKIENLGKSNTSPFEVHIIIEGKALKITNVGYGVSQILPLIVEILTRPKDTWFSLQQPEIHLHPKAQAAFGNLIFSSSYKNNHKYIIETHSDYTIDRYRLNLFENNKAGNVNKKSQIVFFTKNKKNNKLCCIPINDNGSLPDKQPKEFREFFIREQLNLLKI